MEEQKDYTQIQVEKKLRDWLAEKGNKTETFNEIIKRLVGYKKCKSKKQ